MQFIVKSRVSLAEDMQYRIFSDFHKAMDSFKAIAREILEARYVELRSLEEWKAFASKNEGKVHKFIGAGWYDDENDYYPYATKIEHIENVWGNSVAFNFRE